MYLFHDPGCIMTLEQTPHWQAVMMAGNSYHDWAIYLAGKYPYHGLPPINFIPIGTVRAEIVHSCWIVNCPFCMAAQDASKQRPQFWCPECGMGENERAPLAVVFPRNADDIEHVLMARQFWKNRNWNPRESISDLITQNQSAGEPTGV